MILTNATIVHLFWHLDPQPILTFYLKMFVNLVKTVLEMLNWVRIDVEYGWYMFFD
jgi:hypothetical protein